MSAFNPGDGWREVSEAEFNKSSAADYAVRRWSSSATLPTNRVSYWVRVDPVPPLLTAPYTVVRVTWPEWKNDTAYLVLETGELLDVVLGHRYPREKFARITGFEVLAEPRAVTAKAVLDRVDATDPVGRGLSEHSRHEIAREFGVEP